MIRQLGALAGDLRGLTDSFDQQAREALTSLEGASVKQVYLTGSGDSHHASCSVEMAFETIAGVGCRPMSAQRFLEYGAPWMRGSSPGDVLVVATSASGATERVVQAVRRAREHDALTIAVTGKHDSPVTKVADRTVGLELPGLERSPGIRTYQASLVGLLLIAIRLGERRRAHGHSDADRLCRELAALADPLDATNQVLENACPEVAEMLTDSPMMLVGSGPSHGTALFAAAKMIEATGCLAMGQDLEEWWHVERFARPFDMPLFVIAPPGRSHRRAADLAATAQALGRRVIAVTHRADTEITRHASAALTVHGEAREEFSPLLYHLFASYTASHLARLQGRHPFQSHTAGS